MKQKKIKNILKIVLILIAILSLLTTFFHINGKNYIQRSETKMTFVNHPELLPETEFVKYTTFGYSNLKSDLYWLEAIQYIGGNAISSDYKKYLFKMLDNITELSPEFEKPYYIGMLLLPSYNSRYEDLNQTEIQTNIDQGEKLGLKGLKTYCDNQKMEEILKENDLGKIWSEDKFKNPCYSHTIPYYLAYLYYYYKHDPENAAKYYKIASANDDAPEGAKTMSAIMQGKGGNREKSFFMFLNIAKYVEKENQTCSSYATQLEQLGYAALSTKEIPLDENFVSGVEKSRNDFLGVFTEEKEDEILSDTKCVNYVNKAIRELNLAYIENADKKYYLDTNSHSLHARELYEAGYIKTLPIDFQQYDDYGIIYEFNNDTQNYDYAMGSYDDY